MQRLLSLISLLKAAPKTTLLLWVGVVNVLFIYLETENWNWKWNNVLFATGESLNSSPLMSYSCPEWNFQALL